MLRLRHFVVVASLLPILAGCGDGSSPATVQPESCLASVEHPGPESGALSIVDRLEVVAVTPEGCAPLDGRLAAFNWFSFDDPDAYAAYGARVSQILASRGTPILAAGERAETLEAPSGAPAGGGSYVHEEFALPHYPSAYGFMDMIASPEFQEIVGLQQGGARQSDYVFGFQQCLVGCDSTTTQLATDEAPLLLHIFRYTGDDIRSAVRDLAGEGPEMVYAGRLVARFQAIVGGVNANSQNLPWGQGTALYRVDSADEARAWLDDSAFRAFRRDTEEDVIVLLGSGRLTATVSGS